MENKFTNQEQQMKSLAEDFSLDIDTAELWGKVEAQLPPEKVDRKRPIVWWFASGVLLLVIALFTWNSFSDKIKDQSSIKSEESSSTIVETPNIASSQKTDNTDLLNNSNESNSTQNIKDSQTKIKTTTSNNSEAVTSNYSESLSTIENTTDNLIPTSTHSNIESTPLSKNIENTSISKPITLKALISPSIENNNEHLEENKFRETLTSLLLQPTSLKPIETDDMFEFPIKEIKPLSISYWAPYFVFSSGVNLHKSTIFSNSTEEINLKQFENEKPLIGLNSNLGFGFENSAGWRMDVSLNHNRIVSRFTQKEIVITTTNVEGDVASKIDDDGNVTFISGTISQTTITDYDLKWHRSHDFLNAQLNIGKRIFQKGNFSFYTDASIAKNLWSRHTGYYFTEDSPSAKKFNSNEDSPYSNAGYNAGLSFGFEYKINEISISLSPFAKVGLNSITQNSNYYQLKNSQYGIQLGVVYRP